MRFFHSLWLSFSVGVWPCAGELRRFCEKMGGERWAVNREEGATLECCPSGSIVMLTPDAPRPLEALDPAKTYVVGGLVDRTPKKGVTATVG